MFLLPSEEREQCREADLAYQRGAKKKEESKIVTPADLITDDQAYMRYTFNLWSKKTAC